MILVDTNVAAYLLIDGKHTAAARELHQRDSDWRSEAFLLVEFTNILASSIATKRINLSAAEDILANAAALFDGKLERVLHVSVLTIAVHLRVSAYDARFLALAAQLDQRLVTEDQKLRNAAPALTQSLSDALAV